MNNSTKVIVFLLVILIAMMFEGCSTSVLPEAKPNIFYRLDLEIEWNKQRFKGYVVLPKRPAYELRFRSPGKMDVFTYKTCSREEIKEEAEFRGNPRHAVVYYKPNEIEAKGGCPAEIGAYERIKGRHSWGMIDFEDDSAKLPAQLICGDIKYSYNGVSICQQREGLLQLIRFQHEVAVRPTKGCELESGNRGKEFEFNIKRGFCIYAFMSIKPPHKVHRLTTYGYEKILLRRE